MTETKTPDEQTIADFWTDFPMVYSGIDQDQATPQEILTFMNETVRTKTPWGHPNGVMYSAWIDYPAYTGKKVLEIGYGIGKIVNEFSKVGAEVHGVDLSRFHHAVSGELFKDKPVDLRLASAEDLPYEDNSFDFVVSWGVIHHASDDQKCYDEVHRVLKPGGQCFLMLYRKGGVKYYYQKLVKKGLFHGGLFKAGFDIERFINTVTDAYTDDSPGAPISRHYTSRDLDHLFRNFSERDYKITGTVGELSDIPFGRLPLSDLLLSTAMRKKLLDRYGGFWLINLTKPQN